jgi:hypothetical protein
MRAARFVVLPPANTALSYSMSKRALIPAAAPPPKK